MRVAFRVDAAPHIGSGHLMRCLTLADSLRLRGCDTHFLCRPGSEAVRSLVQSGGHHWHDVIPTGESVTESGAPPHAAWLGSSQLADCCAASSTLDALHPEWLVVDHYALDHRWERQARPLVGRILVIDDLADRNHDCDLLLDQNFHIEPERRYEGRVSGTCRRLLGPRHALLRPEFAAARARRRRRDGSVASLLISLGGADLHDITALALDAALRLSPACTINVVVGADYAPRDALSERCATYDRVRLHVQTDRMNELVDGADLAIGAAGASALERLCLGLPTVNLAIADNQVPGLTSLCEAGLTLGLTSRDAITVDSLLTLLQSLRLAPAFNAGMAERGAALVDGQGCRRVANAMLPPIIELRYAGPDDCEDLLIWRNDPSVRANSHHSQAIARADHQRWFDNTLIDPQRALLVGHDESGAVGVARFDLLEAEAKVSVYLVPVRQGQGLGAGLLLAATDWIRRHHPRIGKLVAEIMPGNQASIAVFEQAGYVVDHHVYVARPGVTPS